MNSELTSMALLGLVTYGLHSTLFLLAALLLTATGLVRHLALRELLWRGALLAGLITTPLQLYGLNQARVQSIALPATLVSAPAVNRVADQAPAGTHELKAARAAADAHQTSVPAPRAGWSPAGLGLAAWALFGGALLLQLGRLVMQLHAQLRGRRPAAEAVRQTAAGVARRLGIRTPTVSVKTELSSPFCLISGEVVLPDWAQGLPPEQLEAMLAHELAHLKRHDPAWLLAGRVIEALGFFQPLNFLANRRLAELSEYACDAWSKKLCRSGLALAECLAECARRQLAPRPASLAMAMATRSSPVLERTRLLLDPAREEGLHLPLATRLGVVCLFIAAGLVAPSFALGERPAGPGGAALALSLAGGSNISLRDDGHAIIDVEHKSAGLTLTIDGRGRFRFNEEETDLLSLSQGGHLDIREAGGGGERRVRFEERGGEVVRRFWRDGDALARDADLDDWLGRVIPQLHRLTGIDARARAERIHRRGGAAAVLEEISHIPGSYTARVYASTLAGLGPLDESQTRRFLDLSTERMGSYDLRETLTAYVHEQDPGPAEWRSFAEAAAKIPSSYDLRETLTAAAEDFSGPASAWHALLEAAAHIGSSYDLRETLSAFAGRLPRDAATTELLLRTARRITSSYDLRETLGAYASAGGFDTDGWLALLEAATAVQSGYDRRESLVSIARHMPREPRLVERYREVAAGIGSAHDRAAAEKAL